MYRYKYKYKYAPMIHQVDQKWAQGSHSELERDPLAIHAKSIKLVNNTKYMAQMVVTYTSGGKTTTDRSSGISPGTSGQMSIPDTVTNFKLEVFTTDTRKDTPNPIVETTQAPCYRLIEGTNRLQLVPTFTAC